MRTKPLTPLWPERRVGPQNISNDEDDMVLAVVACPRIRSSAHHPRPSAPRRNLLESKELDNSRNNGANLAQPRDETARTTGRPGRNERETDMTRRAVHRMPAAPRRRLLAGVAVLAAWVLVAHASFAGAQPAVGPAAETASASPQAPPPEQLPGPGSSVAGLPGLLRFQLSPKFLTGVQIGRFGNKIGTTPGGAVDFTARVAQTPVSVGAAFDYLRYGTETRRIALFPAVPEVLSDIDTNNLFRAHALVRFQPSTGRMRPYAEGLLGFSYVYTHTSVDLGDEGDQAGTTHLGDFAPSVGAGGGVTIGLASVQDARVALDIGLRYLTGGEVDYLTRGELQRNENGVTFEPTRSPATLFALQIGIAVDF